MSENPHSGKPPTCYFLQKGTRFLHLSGLPQPLGPVAAVMARVTPMHTPYANESLGVRWALTPQ